MKTVLRFLVVLGLFGFSTPFVEGRGSAQTHDEAYWRKQLKIAEKANKNDTRILESLIALARIAHREGEIEKAASHLKKAVKFQERTVGKSHLELAATLDKLAELYLAIKWTESANEEAISEDGTRYLVYSPANKVARCRDAEKVITRALEIRRRHWGPDSLHLVPNLRQLARAQAGLRKRTLALRTSREADRVEKLAPAPQPKGT